jgi:hypothetical protein
VIPTTILRQHSHGGEVPFLCRHSGQLLHAPYWMWLCCSCGHRVAVALVPFVIRWGADASSDVLRTHARCTVCGRRGASLQHPSWADEIMGWEVFPLCSK